MPASSRAAGQRSEPPAPSRKQRLLDHRYVYRIEAHRLVELAQPQDGGHALPVLSQGRHNVIRDPNTQDGTSSI
jgi:hypothetical protein